MCCSASASPIRLRNELPLISLLPLPFPGRCPFLPAPRPRPNGLPASRFLRGILDLQRSMSAALGRRDAGDLPCLEAHCTSHVGSSKKVVTLRGSQCPLRRASALQAGRPDRAVGDRRRGSVNVA